MHHFSTLLLQFYRPFWWYHLLFTIIGVYAITIYGLVFLLITILFKLSGYASALGYQYYFNSNVYYYYRNAGYSVRRMYLYAFGFDFLIFIILLPLCVYISHHINA
ncbi:hypothetical protein [Mucilaginibacter lacusdianchii]|uniref:hypothetical protein n=1 Tax=Mucilaginibacter lacusdianchii TaxID=2684211 RepID=UPI00131B790E|nr:hypothetical protein [Mucilaginibacter sp. JXJ CY 39]